MQDWWQGRLQLASNRDINHREKKVQLFIVWDIVTSFILLVNYIFLFNLENDQWDKFKFLFTENTPSFLTILLGFKSKGREKYANHLRVSVLAIESTLMVV